MFFFLHDYTCICIWIWQKIWSNLFQAKAFLSNIRRTFLKWEGAVYKGVAGEIKRMREYIQKKSLRLSRVLINSTKTLSSGNTLCTCAIHYVSKLCWVSSSTLKSAIASWHCDFESTAEVKGLISAISFYTRTQPAPAPTF